MITIKINQWRRLLLACVDAEGLERVAADGLKRTGVYFCLAAIRLFVYLLPGLHTQKNYTATLSILPGACLKVIKLDCLALTEVCAVLCPSSLGEPIYAAILGHHFTTPIIFQSVNLLWPRRLHWRGLTLPVLRKSAYANNSLLCPSPRVVGGIKRWCASDVSVCRVHRA